MTVGYLKAQLDRYPDDASIILDVGPVCYVLNDENILKQLEVIDMYSVKGHENVIFIQTRQDFDYMNELSEKKAHFIEEGAENWKEMLIDQGFTEDEITGA